MNNQELLNRVQGLYNADGSLNVDAATVVQVYDPTTNQLHFQTMPYRDSITGDLVVKRLASFPVKVIQVGSLVEEYTATESY